MLALSFPRRTLFDSGVAGAFIAKRIRSRPFPHPRIYLNMGSLELKPTASKVRLFDPHETACAHALAGAPLASFWQRAAAFAIDLVLVLLIYTPVAVFREYLEQSAAHHPLHFVVNFNLHELEDLIWIVVYAGLSVWVTNGFTVGKRLFHIRVVSLTRPRISLWQSVERALGYGASALEFGFGFIQFFIHHNRQCVHDRIAETIVIREPARTQPPPRR
jgi:uncharacterized RDD family membrane protein YckC